MIVDDNIKMTNIIIHTISKSIINWTKWGIKCRTMLNRIIKMIIITKIIQASEDHLAHQDLEEVRHEDLREVIHLEASRQEGSTIRTNSTSSNLQIKGPSNNSLITDINPLSSGRKNKDLQ